MATMITARRAMPPSMTPESVRSLPGSLIRSGFAGLVLCHAFLLAIERETCVGHATYTRLGVCHPEEIAMPASRKQLVCQDFLCSFITHLLILF